MKTVVQCKTCKKEIKINGIDSRIELKKIKGREFELYCDNCKQKNIYGVNSVYAKISYFKYFLILIITTVISFLLFIYFYKKSNHNPSIFYHLFYMIFVPWMFFFVYLKEENKSIRNFNRYRI